MAPTVREALRAVDPDLPLLQPQALTTRIAQTVADRKLALVLLGQLRRRWRCCSRVSASTA